MDNHQLPTSGWTALVAEDHPIYADGIVSILRSMPEVENVVVAQTGDAAIRLALEGKPRLIIMDIHMPGMSGIEACRTIRDALPESHILMLTMFDDDRSVFAAMRAGARGYLLKEASQDDIVRAARSVAGGEAIFSPAIARRMMYYFEAAAGRRTTANTFPELTEREREILDWIARGSTNAEIAKTLGITPKTMRNYASTILNKLHAADRAEVIEMARKAGYGEPGDS